MGNASDKLEHGDKFPYDGGEDFWNDKSETPTPAKDWAHRAARGILADLDDRGGLDHILDNLDHDIRQELAETMAEIIREAHRQASA